MGFFGLGTGKMALVLKSPSVSPGGTLEGTATLTLDKDAKAKGVFAHLYAKKEEQYMGPQGRLERRTIFLYKNEQKLDSEKVYLKDQSPMAYNFSFVIPQMGAVGRPQNETGGAIMEFAQEVSLFSGNMGFNQFPIRWYVDVKLEMTLAFPVAITQEINVLIPQSQPPPAQAPAQ
jgi:hypothetical protein